MSTSPTTTREWRCRSCSALLGVARGGEVEVRYKTAAYRVRGELTTHCRRSSKFNVESSKYWQFCDLEYRTDR